MSALDDVLEAYRDTFGVKTDRANETHRLACVEVSELRSRPTQDAADLACACGSTEFYELSGSYYCNDCGNAKPAKPLI